MEGRKTIQMRKEKTQQAIQQEEEGLRRMIQQNRQIVQQHDERIRQLDIALEDFDRFLTDLPKMDEGTIGAQGMGMTMLLNTEEKREAFKGIVLARRERVEKMRADSANLRTITQEAVDSMMKSLQG